MNSKARKRSHSNASKPAPAVKGANDRARKRNLAMNRTLAPVCQALASASFIGGVALVRDPKSSTSDGVIALIVGVVLFLASYRAHLKGDF